MPKHIPSNKNKCSMGFLACNEKKCIFTPANCLHLFPRKAKAFSCVSTKLKCTHKHIILKVAKSSFILFVGVLKLKLVMCDVVVVRKELKASITSCLD